MVAGGANDDVLTGVVAIGSRLFAVGYTRSYGAGGADAVILEISPSTGAILSTTLYGDAQDDFANGAATEGSDLYVVGESRSFATNGNAVGENDVMLLRYTLQITVSIDIKPPGSDPNSINPRSKGVIPVAILTISTAAGEPLDFDATIVDPLSVKFGPNGASALHGKGHIEDVDGDGDLDMVLHFKTQETGIQCGDTEASLTGKTTSGQNITGTDNIRRVGCGLPKVVAEEKAEDSLPAGYFLYHNYPNPFNPETEIRFHLPESNHVLIKIYNIHGEEIRTLLDVHHEAGFHIIRWDGKDNNGNPVSSGVYLYRFKAGSFTQMKNMTLIR